MVKTVARLNFHSDRTWFKLPRMEVPSHQRFCTRGRKHASFLLPRVILSFRLSVRNYLFQMKEIREKAASVYAVNQTIKKKQIIGGGFSYQ